MRGSVNVLVLAVAAALSQPLDAREDIRLQGSASVADALRGPLEDGFTARFADVQLTWDDAGSGAAFIALFAGDADVGIASRSVRSREVSLARRLGLELKESVFALDGLAVVVHPRNDVPSLSLEDLEALYSGRIVRWLGFRGIDEPVTLLSTTESSGAPAEFRQLVFEEPPTSFPARVAHASSSIEILDRVASERGAVGFVSMSYDRSRVRTVPISSTLPGSDESLLPSAATVGQGAYPLSYAIRLYTVSDPSDELGHFLRFLYLHEGSTLVAEAGLVPVQAFTGLMRNAAHPRARVDVTCRRISFGFRGRRLDADARSSLADVATHLTANPDDGVWITGHEEPTEARDGLAEARGRTVADFLEQQSVDSSRMTVDSRGTSEPIASNDELAGRRLNRRVDVWILPH